MATPKSSVSLRISCKNLMKKDIGSESDPVAVVEQMNGKDWIEVGRTEHLKNCKSPQFTKTIDMDYMFEQTQKLRVKVYDIDNIATASMNDDELITKFEVTLGTLVSKGSYIAKEKRSSSHDYSEVTIHVEKPSNDTRLLSLNFTGSKLDNKDFLGKSDPFLEMSKFSHGSWIVVVRSSVVKDCLDPVWPPVEAKAAQFDSDDESKIKIACFDYDKDGTHDLIGECETTLSQLIFMAKTRHQVDWDLINPKKQAKKKNYKNSGVLHLKSCDISHVYNFLHYVTSGCQINFTVGIDFTGSNGDPKKPNSLHYMVPGGYPNCYQQAIEAVGAVIQDYDSDKLFPGLGFGAKIEGTPEAARGEALHEFALNFNPSNPFCAGVAGLVEAYRSALGRVELWGPTCFAPIINHVANFARQAHAEASARNYYVLLMLTDGAITDMAATVDSIVACSHLPMSIIIVGVGDADFDSMDTLDGDGGKLHNSARQPAVRDVVQFVPFNKFQMVGQTHVNTALLSQQVLAEVPAQVESYFKMRRIPPIGIPPQ